VKLEDCSAQLEAMARIIREVSFSAADLYLTIRYGLVVKVGLVRKGECVRSEVERFRPRGRARDSYGTEKQK
jgi:hypothetical protein